MTWYQWCPCCYHLCQIVLVMLGHYSSYANVTVHNQVKSKVALIMQWASHGCDSYECCVIIVSTCCNEWWQSDHLSSSPRVWRSPVWGGRKMHLLCCCWVTLSFLVKVLLAPESPLNQTGWLNTGHVWETRGAPATVEVSLQRKFPALIVLEWAQWCGSVLLSFAWHREMAKLLTFP